MDNGSVTDDPKYNPLKTELRNVWLVRGSKEAPPLSATEMTAVMKWIAVQVSAIELPTCWRDSDTQVGEIAGRVADCESGYTNFGLTCTRGSDNHWEPSKLASCPDGFTNTGTTCFRGASTRDKLGSWCTGGCPDGYTDLGCFCGRAAWSRKLTEAGKCPTGYFISSADGRCHVDCKTKYGTDYTNTGDYCFRPADTTDKKGMSCKANERLDGVRCYPKESDCGAGRENIAGLCYDKCKPGSYRVGLTCWSSCPRQQPEGCAAACSTTQEECLSATADMVMSVGALAFNMYSLGGASAAKNASKPALWKQAASKLGAAYKKAKPYITVEKGASNVKNYYDEYARMYAESFEDLTSPAIKREIEKNFGVMGSQYIERQWGMSHLTFTLAADKMVIVNNIADTMAWIPTMDPLGVSGVISAFMHPVCSADSPFPTVHRLYTY